MLSITVLVSLPILAQSADDAAELLRKVRSVAENTGNWRAEVIETSKFSGPGMDLQSGVRIKIAAQAPLKMSRRNSGADQTILVCDGVETFYSGDGHSYYRGEASATPQCDFPLNKFYELDENAASVSVAGRDHVRLADGDRECVLVRAEWKHNTPSVVRTMCIDPVAALILRDVTASGDGTTGIKVVRSRTFIDYESNPAFPPDAFRFSIPDGAVEAKPPI